jgi:hypothetical protein
MQQSILTLVAAFTMTAVAYANPVRFGGCDYALLKFQNLASYGPFHRIPDQGRMYVRLLLKVHNRSNDPKTINFTDMQLRDESGRTYSFYGVGNPLNMNTIPPGFSCEAEVVFMVAVSDLGRPMTLLAYSDSKTLTAELPVNDKLEGVPQQEYPAQEALSRPKVVNGRYVYDDSGVTPTPVPTP